MDPKVLMVLELPKWVAPNPLTKPALKPKFDWVVVYEPAELPEFYERVELAIMPKLNKVGKLAIKPELEEVSELAIMPELNEVSELAIA